MRRFSHSGQTFLSDKEKGPYKKPSDVLPCQAGMPDLSIKRVVVSSTFSLIDSGQTFLSDKEKGQSEKSPGVMPRRNKKKAFVFSVLFIVVLVMGVPHPGALAAGPSKSAQCREKITSELEAVHDEYRAHLFGARRGGNGIDVLTGGKTTQEVQGIFETKGRLTSELIEPVVESYRVYRCRSLAVCGVMQESLQVRGGEVTIRELGCTDRKEDRYGECYFAGTPSPPDTGDAELFSELTGVAAECKTLVEDSLAFEKAVLRLAVAYDAGYRSLLQFAGMMDWMLEGFDASALRAIADMVHMLGKLHQIPCFISQCDAPQSPTLQ